MSLERFSQDLNHSPEVGYADREWSQRWMERLFEFLKRSGVNDWDLNADLLIAYLVAVKNGWCSGWATASVRCWDLPPWLLHVVASQLGNGDL
jgi:hypothetical protein